MSTIQSSYYSNELSDWGHAIGFYEEENDNLGQQLGEVISRNCIIGIAEKVEAEQALLNHAAAKFGIFSLTLRTRRGLLRTDSTFIDDTGVTDEMQEMQDAIRRKMQEAETAFVDVNSIVTVSCRIPLSTNGSCMPGSAEIVFHFFIADLVETFIKSAYAPNMSGMRRQTNSSHSALSFSAAL